MASDSDFEKNKKIKLALVGQREYFRCHYENDLDDLFDIREFQLLYDPPEAYYEPLLRFNADINIIFRGELMPAHVISNLNGIRVAFSTEPLPKIIDGSLEYTLDSLERFKAFIRTFDRAYHFVFHYDAASATFLRAQGISLSGFQPLPIATETYRPLELAQTRDILFLGRSTPHREEFLTPLKRDFDVFHVAHGLPSSRADMNVERDLLPVTSSFKVVLNIHAEPEPSWEPRVQQMLACRALLLSEPISANEYLSPGIHYLEADHPTTMYDACREIVSTPSRFEGIRTAGYELVRRRLSARTWFPAFTSDLLKNCFVAPTFERRRLRVESLEMIKRLNGMEHLATEFLYSHA